MKNSVNSTIVDLVDSNAWIQPGVTLPSWLDEKWMETHSARFICAISDPEHLNKLWQFPGVRRRLIGYPNSPINSVLMDAQGNNTLVRWLCQTQGFSRRLRIEPGTTSEAPPEKWSLPEESRPGSKLLSLALISPIPPSRTGIADYCAELLPALAQRYQVTLVVADPDGVEAGLAEQYRLMDHATFMRNGGSFDRLMYHFGNSGFHYDYFQLLKAYPGYVVLHDVFLGDGIYSNHEAMGDTELRQEIYLSHGWSAMLDCETSATQSVGLYPASFGVFAHALGVAVHSRHAGDLLGNYFDTTTLQSMHITALARAIRPLPSRDSARCALGIQQDARVIASFGQINRNKCLEELMAAWVTSGLSEDSANYLCLVGHCTERTFSDALRKWQKTLPHPDRLVIAGHTDSATYEHYLAATDIAVQLRRDSRGESSAALLDCMGAGICAIANAHGSAAQLPDDKLLLIKDNFSTADLADALFMSAKDLPASHRRGLEARGYVKDCHAPSRVVADYCDHMEDQYQHSGRAALMTLRANYLTDNTAKQLGTDLAQACSDFEDIAACFTTENRALCARQLLIDVSDFLEPTNTANLKQRLNGSLLSAMISTLDPDLRAEAIYFDERSCEFRYARHFTTWLLELSPLCLYDDVVTASGEDAYLRIGENTAQALPALTAKLQLWAARGVTLLDSIANQYAEKNQQSSRSGMPPSHYRAAAKQLFNTIFESLQPADI